MKPNFPGNELNGRNLGLPVACVGSASTLISCNLARTNKYSPSRSLISSTVTFLRGLLLMPGRKASPSSPCFLLGDMFGGSLDVLNEMKKRDITQRLDDMSQRKEALRVGGIVCVESSTVCSPITNHVCEGTGSLSQQETITYCGVDSVQRFHNPGILGVN